MEGRHSLASLKLPKCDDACHLPALSFPPPLSPFPSPLISLLSAPLHALRAAFLPLASPRTPDGDPALLSCLSVPHPPPETRCQKIKVHAVLFHGQVRFSYLCWHKSHLVVFLKNVFYTSSGVL